MSPSFTPSGSKCGLRRYADQRQHVAGWRQGVWGRREQARIGRRGRRIGVCSRRCVSPRACLHKFSRESISSVRDPHSVGLFYRRGPRETDPSISRLPDPSIKGSATRAMLVAGSNATRIPRSLRTYGGQGWFTSRNMRKAHCRLLKSKISGSRSTVRTSVASSVAPASTDQLILALFVAR